MVNERLLVVIGSGLTIPVVISRDIGIDFVVGIKIITRSSKIAMDLYIYE